MLLFRFCSSSPFSPLGLNVSLWNPVFATELQWVAIYWQHSRGRYHSTAWSTHAEMSSAKSFCCCSLLPIWHYCCNRFEWITIWNHMQILLCITLWYIECECIERLLAAADRKSHDLSVVWPWEDTFFFVITDSLTIVSYEYSQLLSSCKINFESNIEPVGWMIERGLISYHGLQWHAH